MRRGEIRWYKLGAPDKRRPVLILTRDGAIDYLGEVTVAPITSTLRDVPSEVPLTIADGMPRDCAIDLHHLQTVSRGRVGPLVTALGPARMLEVRTALLFALGF